MSITPVKSHLMRIRSQFDAIMLNKERYAVFLRNDMYDKSTPLQLVLSRSDVRRRRGALISYSILFSVKIDAYRHVLPIEINRQLQECF